MFIGILISFYVVFALLLASITNSIQIGLKTKKLKVFTFCLILVGQSGRSKNSCSYFKRSIAIWMVINDLCTEEPRNKASANKENPPITTRIFSPQMPFLLILYIGNKASLAIRHEINWSLEMHYCGVPLYLTVAKASAIPCACACALSNLYLILA